MTDSYRIGTCAVLRRKTSTGYEVLMHIRKGSHGSGTLSFPGGRVDPGEDPLTTVIRELEEETGLTPKDLATPAAAFIPFGFVADEIDPGNKWVTLYYEALVDPVREIRPRVMEPSKVDGGWIWVREPLPFKRLFMPVQTFLRQCGEPFEGSLSAEDINEGRYWMLPRPSRYQQKTELQRRILEIL